MRLGRPIQNGILVHRSRYSRFRLTHSLSVCRFICIFIYLTLSLTVRRSLPVSVHVSLCLSRWLFVSLTVCISVCLSLSLFLCLSLCLSLCPSLCLSLFLSFCFFVYLSVSLSVCLSPWTFIVGGHSKCHNPNKFCEFSWKRFIDTIVIEEIKFVDKQKVFSWNYATQNTLNTRIS